jgi:5-oxoprolinase (ATP-hydrolysing)
MSNAIKKISVQRGYDVSNYTMSCFGGAGAQHACLVADSLGIKKIHLHPFAGVLSAFGMGLADTRVINDLAIESILHIDLIKTIEIELESLKLKGIRQMSEQSIETSSLKYICRLQIRYDGSDSALSIKFDSIDKIIIAFEDAHRARFGFISKEKQLIVESIQVETVSKSELIVQNKTRNTNTVHKLLATKQVVMNGKSQETAFYNRDQVATEIPLLGPAVIVENTSTIIIEPGWQAELSANNDFILKRAKPLARQHAIGTSVDPVMLEIFNNLFMNVAEQMGTVLENTAASVNIKERLDFSCAIFTPKGDLVANAPHVPVHLGSMSDSIKTIIRENYKTMMPGDAYLMNAPYNGGTHLPDITLIKPVFDILDEKVVFYVASRGHHADIGGITPGSAPAHSTHVEEEGILIDNFKLVSESKFLESEINELLNSGPYPSRNSDQNIADLKAQVAACEKGAQELNRVIKSSMPICNTCKTMLKNQ